ncbi:MAG: hypothetical protein CR988_06010 [Treponema sp.]|nr:MAG: hypothetical protein CR988_06010 [Treponema sp.]
MTVSSCLSFLSSDYLISDDNSEKNSLPQIKIYTSTGESPSLMTAINDAKTMAIRKGIIDLIGVYSEQKNQNELQRSLYNTKNTNLYIENSEMKVLQKYRTGSNYFCQIQVPVKLNELSAFLKAKGIDYEKESTTGAEYDNPYNKNNGNELLEKNKKSAEEKGNAAYLEDYLENMTYMVFSAENSKTDAFLLKSAVEMVNSYLVGNGYRVIGYSEIEKLKKDNSIVFEESEQTGVSAIQWIAQKLNADIYLEVDAFTESGNVSDNEYYGSAKVTVRIFNPSTGEVLGSVPYASQRTFSDVSGYDAESNALQSTVYKTLPIVEDQSKIMLAKAYSKGIRYELIFNGTSDPAIMRQLKAELKKRVESIKTLHVSEQQTKYALFNFSEADDVADIVYDIAGKLPGFENMELVMLRGKSLTFTMGN